MKSEKNKEWEFDSDHAETERYIRMLIILFFIECIYVIYTTVK